MPIKTQTIFFGKKMILLCLFDNNYTEFCHKNKTDQHFWIIETFKRCQMLDFINWIGKIILNATNWGCFSIGIQRIDKDGYLN